MKHVFVPQEAAAMFAAGLPNDLEFVDYSVRFKRRERIRQKVIGFIVGCVVCGGFDLCVDVSYGYVPVDLLAIAIAATIGILYIVSRD